MALDKTQVPCAAALQPNLRAARAVERRGVGQSNVLRPGKRRATPRCPLATFGEICGSERNVVRKAREMRDEMDDRAANMPSKSACLYRRRRCASPCRRFRMHRLAHAMTHAPPCPRHL